MSPKRKTLDGIGMRVRPRTYDLSYLKPAKPSKQFHDVLPAKKVPLVDTSKGIQEIALKKAVDLLNPAMTVPATPVAAQPTRAVLSTEVSSFRPATLRPEPITTQPNSISEIVSSIQSDSTRDDSERSNGDESSPAKVRIKQIVLDMFADHRSIVISTMSLFLLIGGVTALISSFSTNQLVDQQVQALTEVASASVDNESLASDEGVPSEEPVPDSVVYAHKAPIDEPRYISIPKIKTKKTRVLSMGLDSNGAIKTPRTTWDTGWYEGSSKPGDKVGASLIVGHVSGLTSGGVFYNLYRLSEGDEILVEMGDGKIYTYKVAAKEEVPLEGINMNNYLVSRDIDKPGLTLMTCAGEYNPVTQTYENRLAVFAVREP